MPNWIIADDAMGYPRIGTVWTPPATGSIPINLMIPGNMQRVHAVERSTPLGGGEFIWLPGNTGVTAGVLVTYDPVNGAVTVGGPVSSGQPVAFATATIPSGSWGWYQVCGSLNNAAKDGTALSAGGSFGLGTVAGTVGAVVATKAILNGRVQNAASAGATVGVITVNNPCIAQS